MKQSSNKRHGLTLIELLTAIAVIGLLLAVLLPAIQAVRESSRRFVCQNNLRQIGMATHTYHDAYHVFPPGFIGQNVDPNDGKGWGWSVHLLPFLEQQSLADRIAPKDRTLGQLVAGGNLELLKTRLVIFRCPSDTSDRFCHATRELSGFSPSGPFAFTGTSPAATFGIKTSTSNYVGSLGDCWNPSSRVWTFKQLCGNGAFGCNSRVGFEDIGDGTSYTFAVGERSWKNYAATWAGVDSWNQADTHGIQMVTGTAFFPMNDEPPSDPFDPNARGAAGFSSFHVGGCVFLMCDGQVRFIHQGIESSHDPQSHGPGVYQRLADRDDGMAMSDPF